MPLGQSDTLAVAAIPEDYAPVSAIPDGGNTCTVCGVTHIVLAFGGTAWCCCSMKAADREVTGLKSELCGAQERLVELEAKLEEETDRSRVLQREVRRYRDSEVSLLRRR